jgi:hypothetical protein
LSEKYIKAVPLYPSFLFSDSLHELPIHFFRLMLKLAAETVLLFKCSDPEGHSYRYFFA